MVVCLVCLCPAPHSTSTFTCPAAPMVQPGGGIWPIADGRIYLMPRREGTLIGMGRIDPAL